MYLSVLINAGIADDFFFAAARFEILNIEMIEGKNIDLIKNTNDVLLWKQRAGNLLEMEASFNYWCWNKYSFYQRFRSFDFPPVALADVLSKKNHNCQHLIL